MLPMVNECPTNHWTSELLLFLLSSSVPVELVDGVGYMIPCRSHHIFCIRCLRQSMNDFATSSSVPVCPAVFCAYELSRHDLSAIPFEQRLFRRLRLLIRTQRRPQCPRCHFYVDLENITDLDQHIETCDVENMIPCEFCSCPQTIERWEEHSRQCRNDPMQRRPGLIEFILPRTKYPFSAKQIDLFIEKQKRDHLPIDAHSIVEALAEFGRCSLRSFPSDLNVRCYR